MDLDIVRHFPAAPVSGDSPDKSGLPGDHRLVAPPESGPRARGWSAMTRVSSECSLTPHLAQMSVITLSHHSDIGHLAQLSVVGCQPHYQANHSRTESVYHQNMDNGRVG